MRPVLKYPLQVAIVVGVCLHADEVGAQALALVQRTLAGDTPLLESILTGAVVAELMDAIVHTVRSAIPTMRALGASVVERHIRDIDRQGELIRKNLLREFRKSPTESRKIPVF